MALTTADDRQTDSHTSRICIARNQRTQLSIGALCYHNTAELPFYCMQRLLLI
jgi:hypothetical protein